MKKEHMIILIVLALGVFVLMCNNSNQLDVAKASGGKTEQVQNNNDSTDSYLSRSSLFA